MSQYNRNELAYLVWRNLGVRVSRQVTISHMEDLLSLEVHSTPQHEINKLRDKIIAHVVANKNCLSLFCDGDCYKHTDGVVLACYKKYQENLNEDV